MRFRIVRASLLSALGFAAAAPGRAQGTDEARAFSFRVGVPASHLTAHFAQYEVSVPVLRLRSVSSGRMGLHLSATAAAVTGGRDTGFLVSLGPSLAVRLPGRRMTLDVGSSVGLLSDRSLGGRNFGGPIEFISHAGFDARVSSALAIGYRIQHMSNASLYRQNPGLNLHVLQLTARSLYLPGA